MKKTFVVAVWSMVAVFLVTSHVQALGDQVITGVVKLVSDKSLTLVRANGETVEATVTEVTKLRQAGRKINFKNIAEGDRAVAHGAADETGVFLAKTIVFKSKPLKEIKKKTFFGTITSLADGSFSLLSANKKSVDEISVNDQTIIRRAARKIQVTELKVGQKIVLVVIAQDDGTKTATRILLVGEGTANQPQTPASPSAR